MIRQWLKRCCIGAMTAVLTVSSLPMSAFAEAGGVTYDAGAAFARVEGNTAIIGNGAIERKFDFANNKVKTTEINNKRANTKLSLAEGGSEEFIIKRTKKDNTAEPVQEPISTEGWTVSTDSEETELEKPNQGYAKHLIDNNNQTIWHSDYEKGGNPVGNLPHHVDFEFGKEVEFESFAYDPRDNNGNPTAANGNIKGYELLVNSDETAPAEDNADAWKSVSKGDFDYSGNKGEAIHVNLNAPQTARRVRLVATSSCNGMQLCGGEEFDLYAEPWTEPKPHEEPSMFLKSSELELDGDPVVTDTNPTINKQQKTGKKLSFKFKPVEFNGATYTITENIVMYNGDHYMRKFLEISVPEADKLKAEIDYIDLESIDMTGAKNTWTIPTDQGGVVRMSVERAILGQPFYADGMFFGCEFPATDTQIVTEDGHKVGRPRYYTGKTMDRLAVDGQATRAEDGSIHYNTWQTVAGAARGTDMGVVQADFFDYIDDISVPSEFRIQYNSWFDNMQSITDENILKSYIEIDRELNNTEVRPLDSWVVDDGWQNIDKNNMEGVWTFNEKFPNQFGPSSQLARDFGSDFGVWIGPRGGYPSASDMADALVKQKKGVKAGGSIDVADRTYLEEYAKTVCDYQDRFHVNYWKWDGFADDGQYNHYQNNADAKDGEPARSTNGPTKGHMIGGKNRMYHVSDMWEAWIDLFEKVRANGEKNHIDNLWISLTTYTHPSPWFLQWANSVWLQCVPDQAGAGINANNRSDSQMDRQLDARDAAYYDFIKENQFQFPLAHLYNHDPVYGKQGTGMTSTTATAEQFQNYLYSMAGRGTSFWELYFSDSLLDEEKYEVVGEFLAWAEANFDMLKHAKMFGSSPASGIKLDTGVSVGNTVEQYANGTFGTYGYAGFNGDQGILTIRNADWKAAKELKFNFDDATLGVVGKNGDEYDYVVERHYTKNGATSSVPEKGAFAYGEEVSLTLQPEESLTIRVTKKGAGDKQGPSIETVRHNGATEAGKTELVVRMDEKVKGDAAFTVNGNKIAADKVKRSADDITYHITLDKAPEQGEKLDVKISGVTDMAGNALADAAASVDFHEGNVVASRCPSRLTPYTKKLASKGKSLVSETGMTVFSQVNTTGHGPLVKQEGAYEFGIDEAGKAYFDFNGVRVTSGIAVNDGAKHTVAATRENNGILKVYVDGTLNGSKYDDKNSHHKTPAGDIVFAGGAFNKDTDEASAKVYDRALGYDEIKAMHDKVIPDMSERNLAKNKPVEAAYTADGSNAAKGGDRPMSMAVDGVKNDTDNNYGEFGSDNKPDKSAYMQVDLGSEYELTGIHMWRYWKDSRKYNNTLVVTSVDGTFSKDDEDDVVVFNADEANECGYGKGEEKDYAETAEGKNFPVMPGTRARYVRVYMNGSDHGKTNHVVELEVMGKNLSSKPGEQIDTSALYQRIDEVRAVIESGKWTPESVQKVVDKLEAAELVADCPKSAEEVKKALNGLEGIEDLLKQGVTVSFQYVDAPEGVAAPAAVEIEEGQALGDKLPVPAAVEGYTFAGWFTDEACTKGHEFDGKTKVTANMTVFGKWVKGEAPVPPAPSPDPEDPKPGETPLTPLEPATPVKPEEKPADRPGKKPSGDKLVQTGDNAMIGIAAAGIAGVALIGAAVVTRKRNRA